jgi:hypothetical protein
LVEKIPFDLPVLEYNFTQENMSWEHCNILMFSPKKTHINWSLGGGFGRRDFLSNQTRRHQIDEKVSAGQQARAARPP